MLHRDEAPSGLLRWIAAFCIAAAAVVVAGLWAIVPDRAHSMSPPPLKVSLTYRSGWIDGSAPTARDNRSSCPPALVEQALGTLELEPQRLQAAKLELAEHLHFRAKTEDGVETVELSCEQVPSLARRQLAEMLNLLPQLYVAQWRDRYVAAAEETFQARRVAAEQALAEARRTWERYSSWVEQQFTAAASTAEGHEITAAERNDLLRQLGELRTQRDLMLKHRTAEHPEVRNLLDDIDAVESRLTRADASSRQSAMSPERHAGAKLAELASLREAYDSAQARFLELSELERRSFAALAAAGQCDWQQLIVASPTTVSTPAVAMGLLAILAVACGALAAVLTPKPTKRMLGDIATIEHVFGVPVLGRV
jgi:hypothetical protein